MLSKIQIELTNACNFNCKGCYKKKMERDIGYISKEIFEQSLKLCRDFNIKEIWLHNWGEPLLHPDLVFFVRKAQTETEAKVGFTTNGYYLNRNILMELSPNLDFLDISFNANTDYIFGHFLKEMHNIAIDYGIETWFRSVVSNKKEYEYIFNEIRHYNIKWQRQMLFDINESRKNICSVIEKMFIIYWDGIIVPCCQIYDGQIIYGNVWNKPEYILKEIQSHIRNHMYIDMCLTCKEVETDISVPYKLI